MGGFLLFIVKIYFKSSSSLYLTIFSIKWKRTNVLFECILIFLSIIKILLFCLSKQTQSLSFTHIFVYNKSTVTYRRFKVSMFKCSLLYLIDLKGKSGANPARSRHCDWLKYGLIHCAIAWEGFIFR